MQDVIIVGGGIGGLTLALALQRRGVAARVYEAAAAFRPVGVGINVLPHATRELAALDVLAPLERLGVATKVASFFNRFGQLIHEEPLGRSAGYATPQLSIHRADLQLTLLAEVRDRLGPARVLTDRRCVGVEQGDAGVVATFADRTGAVVERATAAAVIACDGISSAIRRQYYPAEGAPRYSGVNMWRGTTRWRPFLTGANVIRAGWLTTGKMVIYPVRNAIDADGRQLVNWVAEIETPADATRDWSRPGQLADFLPAFADWRFDWLDVPAFLRAAEQILEFPMVDQDPLPAWSFGRVTLLGDAAHPMVPRGSNGAGQSILDARALADCLAADADPQAALQAYEALRLGPTSQVVLANRTRPPDAILGEVFQRTGDKPFERIEDVISRDELVALSDGYKAIAGYALGARDPGPPPGPGS